MKKLNHINIVKLYEVLDVAAEDSMYMGAFCQHGVIFGLLDDESFAHRIERQNYLATISCAILILISLVERNDDIVFELCELGALTEVSVGDKPGKIFTDSECRDVFQQMVLGIEYRKFGCS